MTPYLFPAVACEYFPPATISSGYGFRLQTLRFVILIKEPNLGMPIRSRSLKFTSKHFYGARLSYDGTSQFSLI